MADTRSADDVDETLKKTRTVSALRSPKRRERKAPNEEHEG
jgi:hypothetical protein